MEGGAESLRRRRMPSDGKSSHGLWPGELKRGVFYQIFQSSKFQALSI
jgi:hypothetical protein